MTSIINRLKDKIEQKNKIKGQIEQKNKIKDQINFLKR